MYDEDQADEIKRLRARLAAFERLTPEKTASDAPVWYSAEAADGWANGYNAAIAFILQHSRSEG